MISLRRIVEGIGNESQYYDLGKDFASFIRMTAGADEKISQQYEKTMNSKLAGKRVRARASRGYKQYEKVYEFDVQSVTIDDYYDNLVIVAKDYSKKPKEYFLKPGYKIQILGTANGQPSPQKGGDPSLQQNTPPQQQPNYKPVAKARMATYADIKNAAGQQPPIAEEAETAPVDAYSITEIEKDIKPWIRLILHKPESDLRNYIKKLGWAKDGVAIYDITIPIEDAKMQLDHTTAYQLLKSYGNGAVVTRFDVDDDAEEYRMRIKKKLDNGE